MSYRSFFPLLYLLAAIPAVFFLTILSPSERIDSQLQTFRPLCEILLSNFFFLKVFGPPPGGGEIAAFFSRIMSPECPSFLRSFFPLFLYRDCSSVKLLRPVSLWLLFCMSPVYSLILRALPRRHLKLPFRTSPEFFPPTFPLKAA